MRPTVHPRRHFRRGLSTAVDAADARLYSPVDPEHVASLRSRADLLASYTVSPPLHPWPSPFTPRSLTALIGRTHDPLLAMRAFRHASLFLPGFCPTYAVFRALLHRLAAARAFHLLPSVLSSLRGARLPRCGEHAFVPLIRAFGLAARPAEALRLFLSIPSFGARASIRSFNALLHALAQNRRFRLVAALFRCSRSRFGIAPDVCTCNTLLEVLCKLGHLDAAHKVLDEMPAWGVVPNVVSYTTVLACYCARGELQGAHKFFGQIITDGWAPNATIYTVLIDGYCHHGQLEDALEIMGGMDAAGVRPNGVTYAVVIEACCKERKSGEAFNLLHDMLDSRYTPSSSLCSKVIGTLCQDGKVEDACEICRKLLKRNVTPDNSILSTLIHWLCKKGKVWEARTLFVQFEKGFVPSLRTYNTLIGGMCENSELQEAGRLWDDMVERGCAPNVQTYSLLIQGFCRAGKAKEGVCIFEEMLNKGLFPNKFTCGVLVDGLCESGEWEEVSKILEGAASSRRGSLDDNCWEIFVGKVITDSKAWNEHLDSVLKL